MKGSRENDDAGVGLERPDTPTMIRRVIFSGRSRGLDVDGQESSFSIQSSSDDSFGDEAGRQLKQELQAVKAQPVTTIRSLPQLEVESKPQSDVIVQPAAEKEMPASTISKSWGSWLWGSEQVPASNIETQERRTFDDHQPLTKASMASTSPPKECNDQPQDSIWQETKSSIPSTTTTSNHNTVSPVLPSYLLPPSYPSDPHRSNNTPLSISGPFTNAHFRTLHVIYRKLLRPKFHPPRRELIRQEIWNLRGKEITIDESSSIPAKGEFVWTVGDGECEVIERFMQECELGWGWYLGRKVRDDAAREVLWGWRVDELAGWLARIVVGEVVREEERKVNVKVESGNPKKS